MSCEFLLNCKRAREIGDSIFSSDSSLYAGECVGPVNNPRESCETYKMFKRVEGILEKTGDDLAEYYLVGTKIPLGVSA
ncbi:MAG: hypothetical protein ABIH28_01765 [archaeon]